MEVDQGGPSARGGSAGTSGGAASPDPSQAWKLLGRDSPAGKALFKLYGGDVGKEVGNKFHAKNAQAHQKKLATGYTPPPLEPEKPQVQRPTVSYPQFGGGSRSYKPPAAINYVPRRRPGEVIQAELAKDAEQLREEVKHQRARGPLLDEREKDRCALLMRYRGQMPQATKEELREAARARGARRAPRTEVDELQDMFDAVVGEIEERRDFLRDMEAARQLKPEVAVQVRAEIAERVREMEKIDYLLKQAHARADEDA